MKTYRIYSDIKKIGDDYYEAKYTEYFEDGTVHCVGTEDFSGERLRKGTKKYKVYKHDGRVMHGAYREGYKMTENVGSVRMSINAVAIKAAKMIYGADVARIEKTA